MTDISRLLESAFAKHQAGQVSAARSLYEQVLKLGDNAEAYHWLGILELQSGAAAEAIVWLQKACELEPSNAQALANLGNACFVASRPDDAVIAYQQSLHLNPASAETLASLGNLFLATERPDKAIDNYKRALQINPSLAEVWRGLATAQLARKEHSNALAAISRAEQEHGRSSPFVSLPITMTRGNILLGAGLALQALACYQAVVDHEPDFAQAHISLGGAHRTLGHLKEAAIHCERAIELEPEASATHYALGLVHLDEGDLEAARLSFEKALEYDPVHGRALRLIASLTRHTPEHPDVKRMQAALSRDDLFDEQRIHIQFGLGKALEDAELYSDAFTQIDAANRLHRKRTSYSMEIDDQLMHGNARVFTKDWMARARTSRASPSGPRSIFIVGMPRSGTSLIEQILASHPDVYGAGELDLIERCTESALGESGRSMSSLSMQEKLEESAQEEMKQIGSDYRARIASLAPDSRYVVDKMPANFMRLGVIHSALPDACIVHARRHPMATCWSMYKNYFGAQGHAYSFDQTELGRYYQLYMKLMDHWSSVLENVIHHVDYEKLVSDQEVVSRKLLAHCDLEWDEACLEFHKNERPVQTLSASQVRQPLYHSAIAQWEHYAAQLEPLATALENGPIEG